jgi:hypothetical protein
MAGRRRRKGMPTKHEMRLVRSQASLAARLAAAATPGERVVVAAQHLSAAMKSADPATAEQLAEAVVEDLRAQAQALTSTRTRSSA